MNALPVDQQPRVLQRKLAQGVENSDNDFLVIFAWNRNCGWCGGISGTPHGNNICENGSKEERLGTTSKGIGRARAAVRKLP